MGIKPNESRIIEISEFCHDVGLLWNKYLPDTNFGWIIYRFLKDNPDAYFMKDPEFLDSYREWLEERRGDSR